MSKHTRRTMPFQARTDPDTGATITRLTPRDVTCHRNYFYQKCFTNDGKRLLFAGEFGPDVGDPAKPNWNYHLLDLESRTALQLTEGARENTFGGFLSFDDKHLYFVRAERNLVRLHLDTLAEDLAYTVPQGWVGYGTWVANTACTKVVGIEIHADDWFPLTDWKKFAQMFHAKPRCRLFSIDLATGQRNVILEQRGWLGHPQYRPHDDRTVAYCHEGPHDLVDARMWFIDEDGTNRRCGKEHAEGESCTHEFWVPDGSAMLYVSYRKGEATRWICALDPVTLEDRRVMEMPACSHLMSNQRGTLAVGDGDGKGDPFLYLFDLRMRTHRRIAHHDSSWGVYKGNRQVTHPHPSFSPDERCVLFSADGDGEPGLYLVELPSRA